MKLFTLGILFFILSTVSIQRISGQIAVQLKIDTFCACPDSIEPSLQGTFGLYQTIPVSHHSSELKDTLIKELDYTSQQSLELIKSSYKLVFTPFDTTQVPSVHYFHSYEMMPNIQLNCFFFNKSHASFLAQMQSFETLVFLSSYYGITNGRMLIRASKISIIKIYDAYCMTYNRCDYYNNQVYAIGEQGAVTDFQLIVLTEKDLELLQQFEADIYTMSPKDNLLQEVRGLNRISLRDQQILFHSKEWISEQLYQLFFKNR